MTVRVALFVLVGAALLAVIGAVQQLGAPLRVNAAALVVLYIAMAPPGRNRGPQPRTLRLDGVILSLVLGYLAEVIGGATRGVESFALAALYVVAAHGGRVLRVQRGFGFALVSFIAALFTGAIALMLYATVNVRQGGTAFTLLTDALATALVAPLVAALLRAIDGQLASPAESARLRWE